jgi:2-dehydro-3-deoxyglucarate aldolase
MTKQFSLKDKLKKSTVTIGSWITLGHPAIAEIMAKAGFDWLTVDMEHSAITLHQAQQLIQVIELAGCVPLVRVEENNPNTIKRAMDAGAHGVIVPMVNTKEDAVRAVNAVKYPPFGTRGVGLARAQSYGMEFEKYKEWVKKESVVIVQIESIQAVKNLEEILQVDGVDAFIVGPYDLSGSIGRPGDFDHPKMITALKRVMQVSKKLDVPAGFHVIPPEVDALLAKVEEGYKFLAFSLDTLFLGQSCKRSLELARRRLT